MMSETKLWNQLNQYVDLYKFNWELSVKLCLFLLGISGAITAYVIKNQVIEYMHFALALPLMLCSIGFWLACHSLPGLNSLENEMKRLSELLELESYPEFSSLEFFVGMTRYIFFTAIVGLVILWVLLQYNS